MHRNRVRFIDQRLLPNQIANTHIGPIYEEMRHNKQLRLHLRNLLAELILKT